MDDLQTKIVAEAHGSRYSIHPCSTMMYHDIKKIQWWDGMNKDIVEYVAKCPNCQQMKAEHLKPDSLTQIIEVSTWKVETINMDFVVGVQKTRRQHDSIWFIVDMMITSANFIPVKSTYRAKDYARLYIDEIVRWHGIPFSIISDRGLCSLHISGDPSRRTQARR